jgi:outer membrane protein OmpA-like peptidoglycan-associated protein
MRFNYRNNPRSRPTQRPGTGPAGSTDHWAVAYAKANPLKIGTAAATLYGLLIIFGYHTYIEYDAAFDIHSLASLIFAAAYVGLLVLAGLSIGLFAPAYFIGAFCIDDQSRRTSNDLHSRLATCFGIAFLAFEGLFALVCLFGDKKWAVPLILAAPLLVYFLYALLSAPWRSLNQAFRSRLSISRGTERWVAWKLRRMGEVVRNVPRQYKSNLKLGAGMMLACFFEVTTLETFLVITRDSQIMQADKPDWWEVARIALWLGVFIQGAGIYLVNAWRNPRTARKHRVFSTALVLFVPIFAPLFVGVATPVFSLTSMLTKTGNFRAAEMTLSDDGCRVTADLSRTLCIRTREGTNKLCNVHVMSRIGSENYVLLAYPASGAESKDDQQGGQRVEKIGDRLVQHVYLPAKDILGIKPDLSVRVFTKEAIKKNLVKTSSICELPKAEEAKPATSVSFAEKDLFEFDDYTLTPQGTKALDAFAQRLIRENTGTLSVDVTGHTDQLGSPYHNLQLSQLRAIAVANFLQAQLDGKLRNVKMSLYGVGSSRAEVPESACPASMPRAGRIACFARNRRVDIEVTRL